MSSPELTVPGPLAPASTLLNDSAAFCMAPWVHLAVAIGGVATPCCEAKGDFGHAGRQPLDEIWRGAAFQGFRDKLRRDERDARCHKCYEVELSGGFSLRHHFNADFAHHAGRVDGARALTPPMPVSLDIRFSNLCNFACRMCWHGSSSKWYADARKLGWSAGASALITSFPTPEAGALALRPLLATVEAMYWAGGEPLMIEEHFAVLEELLVLGRDDVALRYNSNLSELRAGGFDVLGLWSRFKTILVEVSVDGAGPRGELIRRGLSWQRLVENILTVKRRCPHVRILIGVTVSVFNVFTLADLHRELVALGCCEINDFRIHVLQEMAFYNIRILPRRLKREIAGRLTAYAQTLPTGDPADRNPARRQLLHVVDHMMSADRSDLIERFRNTTRDLDRLRGEKTGVICPELGPLLRVSLSERIRHVALWARNRLTRRFPRLSQVLHRTLRDLRARSTS